MDNNQNMEQQQQTNNDMFAQQFSQNTNGGTKVDIMSILPIILSGVGCFMALLGTIFTCTCSASKSYDVSNMLTGAIKGNAFTTSGAITVSIIAALIAVAGVVLGFLAVKKNAENKMAKISIALGAFAFLLAVIPAITICGYNCSLSSNYEDATTKAMGDAMNSLNNLFK